MTLEQLRIFLAVAEEDHITRAAERLHMTQSAVSAAISALENRHGIQLFDRVGRSIRLNRNGRLFRDEARKVLAAARQAETVLADLSGLRHGALSIMASRTIGSYWLPPHLATFRRQHPGIDLTVTIGNTDAVLEAVADGQAEIGLIEWPESRHSLQSIKIAEDEMIVVVAPDHPWATRDHPIADLRETSWVVREEGSGTRRAFDTMLETYGASDPMPTIALELPGNEAILNLVENGLGATLMSRSAAAPAIERGRLVEVPISPIPRPYFLMRHTERYHSKAADAFAVQLTGKGG
ncbi:LysR family transcriptional regulator [Rhizobium alvei]|uniref:LysR family transcriptional regulator n=1 Tax=Rhizobium alvei TaxID=1132659 RepID=A0ABT8YTJ7_9HYPH|nr:LysR family transcriptional regulator [Rhizobium alvei]MDO6967093.1 LysR family transcriptional regulator [Rhizobium alvei]